MKKQMQQGILAVLVLGIGLGAVAQKSRIKQGDKHFDSFAYAEAIEDYEAALEQGADSVSLSPKLADSYYNIRDFENAANWYEAAVTKSNDAEKLARYSDALKSMGKYDDAQNQMERLLDVKSSDSRAKMAVEAGNYVPKLMSNPERYTLNNLSINTARSEFGGAYNGSEVVFSSSRNAGVSTKRIFRWNNEPFLDLYKAERDSTTGNLTRVKSLSRMINSRFHEGPVTYCADGNKIYFSRSNFNKGKVGKDNNDVVRLKLFSALKDGDSWENPIPFDYNSDDYSVSHPTLSADGNTLYFASDMPGGYGGVDIWKATKSGTADWAMPVNMGSNINTEGDELFPYCGSDGTLYFASDGWPGLGGLDVVYATAKGSTFNKAENMGYPLNSQFDDFAFTLDKSGEKGYVSSNRPGGKGDDDIYSVNLKPMDKLMIAGQVVDKEDMEPLEAANVRLINSNGEVVEQLSTSTNGNFMFDLPKDECNLKVQVDNGKGWTTYESLNTPCDKTDGKIDLGGIALEKMEWGAKGTVRERMSRDPVGGFLVTLTDKKTGETYEKTTTEDGGVGFALAEATDYDILFEKEGYFSKSGSFSTDGMEPGVLDINKYVDLTFEKIVIGKGIKIENIYYDYNKANIRDDAALELDKIVHLLEDNPSIMIEMGSHTDARGKAGYNQNLSQRRAKSAMDYIVSKGILKQRLTYKGYGESEIINRCADGVNCSDEEHEENRRTEFKVLGMIEDE